MEFIDLKAQQALIRDKVERRIKAVLDHGIYIMGPEVGELEEKLASYVGVKHCISCASGTDAILMALMAYGIGPGDAVFTTPFTFIATAEVIALLGATPVFVDIDPNTFNIDPKKLEDAIVSLKVGEKPTPGMPDKLTARGIIPVDIFGLPADYDRINKIAREHDLFVVEDGAQSFGAVYKGRRACGLADVGTTSFFPAKPLGCYGDGGAVFTDNDEIAEKVKSIRIHGKGKDKYDNVRIGINGRLDTIQAAVLLEKLEIFDGELEKREQVSTVYRKELDSFTCHEIPDGYQSAWAQFSILSDNRSVLLKYLGERGIPTNIYYPKPLHLQNAFSFLQYQAGNFPVSESVSQRIFSLPMHPYISRNDVAAISSELCKYYKQAAL